ncbi:MAG: hypothetical protein QOD07_2970 [Frankiaceae bacterium]|nr:hypothetical protein [Frankiaceae bacterium]
MRAALGIAREIVEDAITPIAGAARRPIARLQRLRDFRSRREYAPSVKNIQDAIERRG